MNVLTFQAISTLLTETEAEFRKEMDKKQIKIDEIHAQLRDASGECGERRRKVEAYKTEGNNREARKLKIDNLARAWEDEGSKLLQLQGKPGEAVTQLSREIDAVLGDADKPLAIPEPAASVLAKINYDPQQPLVLSPTDRQALATSLPPLHVLRARVNAYKGNNQELEEQVMRLQSKSSEQAAKYRKLISLCTGEEEASIDTKLENLMRAVESERPDVELGRVRDFLQRAYGV